MPPGPMPSVNVPPVSTPSVAASDASVESVQAGDGTTEMPVASALAPCHCAQTWNESSPAAAAGLQRLV